MHHPCSKAFLFLLLLLCLLPDMTACGSKNPPPPAEAVLTAMLDAATGHPVGQTYTRSADPTSANYLRGTLFSALYGPAGRGWLGTDGLEDDAATDTSPLINDGAVFLSTAAHPFEIGVFRCNDVDSALSVAALCRARLDALARTWQNSDYSRWTERAVVTVKGCYVLFVVSDDPEPLLTAAVAVVM